ncbi:MAG: hypothetical protein ACSLE5_04975 [Porticoccaceae bacterium]
MNMRHLRILVLLISCLPIGVSAATFTVLCDNSFEAAEQACSIQLSGRIQQGDAARLRAVLQQDLLEGWRYGSLLLDSQGGSVNAALEVADLVRKALLDTTTFRPPKDATSRKPRDKTYKVRRKCISACFLIWVAGADRNAFTYSLTPTETSDIGLHRPYLDRSTYKSSPERVAEAQQQVMLATSEFLKREQVPQALIEKMLQRASTQVYWLTDEDPGITGLSPWFEEMMIARCGYDPTYDRESLAWVYKEIDDDSRRQLATGKKKLVPTDLGPRYAKYIEWRQRYNTCQYEVRKSAQAALRQ